MAAKRSPETEPDHGVVERHLVTRQIMRRKVGEITKPCDCGEELIVAVMSGLPTFGSPVDVSVAWCPLCCEIKTYAYVGE